ncbi:MAG: FGGY-family carbohydrate kinase [Bacteroidales bacterium]|nr:FGGY-family carbohydrate kinase [Bacteroidales bacterium]
MSSLGTNLFLILDIGTSYIKCGCVDSKNNILALCQREFPMQQRGSFFEIDFDQFLSSTQELLKECLADPGVKDYKVKALLITSQAQTFAPVDADFQPLRKGIVWLDDRAEKEADFLGKQLPDYGKTAGFVRPLAEQYVSKLLWLKKNEASVFEKAYAFPLINEYLVQKLTGKFYSDITGFGMSGMFDFRSNSINKEILSILGLTEAFFPEIGKPGVRGELISKGIQQKWDLPNEFPVYLCGFDQGVSAYGSGVKKTGDVNINLGTAMVFYTITESLTTDLSENQIAGKHSVGNDYFLLNLENDFGIQIRQLKEDYFQNDTYDLLFQTYLNYPDVLEKRPPFDKVDLNSAEAEDAHKLCAGIIKYYVNRLKVHFAQISKSVELKNIFISGGMAQSKVWLEILGSSLNLPFTINKQANAGIFGAIKIYNYYQ